MTRSHDIVMWHILRCQSIFVINSEMYFSCAHFQITLKFNSNSMHDISLTFSDNITSKIIHQLSSPLSLQSFLPTIFNAYTRKISISNNLHPPPLSSRNLSFPPSSRTVYAAPLVIYVCNNEAKKILVTIPNPPIKVHTIAGWWQERGRITTPPSETALKSSQQIRKERKPTLHYWCKKLSICCLLLPSSFNSRTWRWENRYVRFLFEHSTSFYWIGSGWHGSMNEYSSEVLISQNHRIIKMHNGTGSPSCQLSAAHDAGWFWFRLFS